MAALKFVPLAALLLGLIVLISCNDSDEGEKRPSSSNGTAQSANQKREAKSDADEGEEGEEGPATPAAVAAERAAPQQTLGKQFAYNFDGDTAGQLPANFHSAKTGGGTQEKWVVTADPAAPSRPNVVAQTSTDQTDYRFPLLISDEGSRHRREVQSCLRKHRSSWRAGFSSERPEQLLHCSRQCLGK
jgi:hypothetical protein